MHTLKTTKLNILIILCFIIFSGMNVIAQPYDGWLYTSGNRIYKSDGTVFKGRGANIFDTRSCWAGAYNIPDVAEVKRRIDELVDDWGADFMRLCLESHDPLEPNMVHGMPVQDDSDYIDDIIEIVEHVGTRDSAYILVSVWVDPSLDESTGWPTNATIAAWRLLVPALANYPYVLFGICNEPRGNSNGNEDATVLAWMNDVVTAIREEEIIAGCNEHIITAQGTRGYARYLGYYVDHPVTAAGGTNIAYETHCYDHENKFNERFIDPAEHIPVLIGEFGPSYMTLDECELMMDLADSLQIPYSAWSFHHNCAPNLLVDNSGGGNGPGMDLVPTEWGEVLRNHLLGIEVPKIEDLIVNPSRVSNQVNTEITISATITNEGGEVEAVTVDLSELGGGSEVDMSKSGDVYSASYTVNAGLAAGVKSISITALNEQGWNKTKSIDVQVVILASEDLIIYNDNETLIEFIWGSNGTLNEVSGGAYEGSEHYHFDYAISGWYANFGLSLNNFGGEGTGYDFTGYGSLKLACKITGTANAVIKLNDADGTSASSSVEITGLNNNYQVFEIPLSSFSGMVLNDVAELQIDLSGIQNESGSFYIDDIFLVSDLAGIDQFKSDKNNFALSQNFPNPFSESTTISFNAPESGHYSLKIYDITNREVAVLLDNRVSAGNHSFAWNGTNSAGQSIRSGIYFYQLKTSNDTVETKKILLLR